MQSSSTVGHTDKLQCVLLLAFIRDTHYLRKFSVPVDNILFPDPTSAIVTEPPVQEFCYIDESVKVN